MMNVCEHLVAELEGWLASQTGVKLEVSKPLRPEGFWFVTLHGADGYTVEAEWRPRRGFGLVGGFEFEPFSGVDEIYTSWQQAHDRMVELWTTRGETSANSPVPMADLRKLRGHLQKDVAAQMGMTKGGLAQIEASANEGKVQVDTLSKLVAAMGGKLVISATFPDGTERKVAVGR
jgi:Helix-turn-helix